MNDKLRLTEIFYSLQGESRTVGFPTVFVRLTGCPLRCQYCDTAYAFSGGELWEMTDIVKAVEEYHPRYVTVTGGEPLAQPGCLELLRKLCDQNYNVSLETSGALDVSQVDSRVVKVLDVKTPGSQEVSKNLLSNLTHLHPQDQIKFVICDRADYEWSKEFIEKHKLVDKAEILFSPSYTQIKNEDLAEWILADRLPVRFQIQLHKYIWGDVQGK
jgi:7-carboxy-7-deazaguanine synthase